jgi:hypothetical protein
MRRRNVPSWMQEGPISKTLKAQGICKGAMSKGEVYIFLALRIAKKRESEAIKIKVRIRRGSGGDNILELGKFNR